MRLQVLQYDQKSKESPERYIKIWKADSSTNTTSEKRTITDQLHNFLGYAVVTPNNRPQKNKSELGMI